MLDKQMAGARRREEGLFRLEAETERLLKAQQAAYAKMAADKAEARGGPDDQLEAQRKLESLIDKLIQEQIAKGGIPSQYNGTFHWPMRAASPRSSAAPAST